MVPRYFKVFRKNLLLIIIIVVLIVVSSVTKGKTAKTTSILAGITMIYLGIRFIIWIIRTPVKREKDEVV
jgi:amino acid permease